MAIRAGHLLRERYELTERIAVGGMGEVWQARDRVLGRTVAAKVLREDLVGDAGSLARLRAEARNASGLVHPNVAVLLDYGEQDGGGFLVMEYVPGEPLSAVLTRERSLPLQRVLPILAQCARGLHAAHEAGVIHRDVKPSNILITPDGTAKLTDFGISLGTGQPALTAAGMVMGTAQYLPPELAMGKPAQPAGDVYALGVIAYEAVVGRRPYTGTTQVDIAMAHVSTPLPPLPAHVPEPVRALITEMLAKDPAGRPPSAAAVASRMERLTADDGPQPDDSAHHPPSPLADHAPQPGAPATHLPSPLADHAPQPGAPAHHPPSPLADHAPQPGAPATHLPSASLAIARAPNPPQQRTERRHRQPSRAEWRRPTWAELAADRRWLVAVGVGMAVIIVLALTLGTLALGGDQPASGPPRLDQPTDRQ